MCLQMRKRLWLGRLYDIRYNDLFALKVPMRLKQLKLAGFKSFVDPTVVPFSSELVAIVGPNGCGKSNIIDAVRWVMGESSAKSLRGESMTDVIFNGSANRKPVGQASVELIFDNSLGRLTGQYAAYQEISVKRLVTRDGDSAYFLNGSRCRRRDISDIFLGTGAGAKGYAIIGQDMISRLVEARPDDLKAYIEEAAGVSKYKERRRETLQRISHTRENLDRVADIREELGKQLLRLERQAKTAQRFKALKEKERLYKAEILALKWRILADEQSVLHTKLKHLSLQYEQQQTQLIGHKKGEVAVKDTLNTTQEQFQKIQKNFYELGHEIARLEEAIHNQQRERLRLAEYLEQLKQESLVSKEKQNYLESEIELTQKSVEELSVNLIKLEEELSIQQRMLQEKQEAELEWNKKWQQMLAEQNTARQKIEITKLNLQHLEQRRAQTLVRLEKIKQEHASFSFEALAVEINALQDTSKNIEEEQDEIIIKAKHITETCTKLQTKLQETEQLLRATQTKVQKLTTERAALQAAQNAAFKVKNDLHALPQWQNNPRLIDAIHVSEPWRPVCEFIFAESLHAILLDSLQPVLEKAMEAQGKTAAWVTPVQKIEAGAPYPRLCDKVSGTIPNWVYAFEHIFAAETLQEAWLWLPDLKPHQSIVTLDGYWLGPGWMRTINLAEQNKNSLLLCKETLLKVNEELVAAEAEFQNLLLRREEIHESLAKNTQLEHVIQKNMAGGREALQQNRLALQHKEQLLQQARSRSAGIKEEIDELQELLESLAFESLQTEHALAATRQAYAQSEEQLQSVMAVKDLQLNELEQCRHLVDKTRAQLHQAELQCNREKMKAEQLQQGLQQELLRSEQLELRLNKLLQQHHELDAPDAECKGKLEEKINLHQQADAQLQKIQQQIDALQAQWQELECVLKQEEEQVSLLREQIQNLHLHEQTLKIRIADVLAALKEFNTQPLPLLEAIPDDVTLALREQELLEINQKIKMLGPVNLVAIDEYQVELERKQNLDEQHRDLSEALVILEAAIAKMDQETERRLEETFMQINTSFQALFPRLFGGGHAKLTLTCDNLLEAGIQVMANPPGKRNSTIHMLSGGEKAMTAVALVFAIFQLNPAPFCMLDEVDAPLDDANVRRFCDLIKEMSQFVQFLFITHNKVTMELADHLMGVTMREPGVSRIVTVDVQSVVNSLE
nr:chromosome segregation protein SMC [Legionella septentrionalis]